MKIMIAGLGLIGGSAAKALARAGYAADGYDRPAVLHAAVEAGVVAGEAKNTAGYDVVFVALPPDAAMRWIEASHFKDGAVVADFCGVKGAIERCVYAKPRNFRYVGCHPMAGKEVSGLQNSCADLFDGASMIVVHGEQTDESAVRLLVPPPITTPRSPIPRSWRTSSATPMSRAIRRRASPGSRAAASRI